MSSNQENKPRVSLWQTFKNEFRLENFSLNFELNSECQKLEPEKMLECFHSIFWPNCNKLLYLIYRISIAIYYTIWLIESIVRNAEYRKTNLKIETSINIFQKEKPDIFLIHPWPFYMTSWSLAVLFFHLWLTAFITLYFYSINKKSCLSSLFSFLFGPFSCSLKCSTPKIQQFNMSTNENDNRENYFQQKDSSFKTIKNLETNAADQNSLPLVIVTNECNNSNLEENDQLDNFKGSTITYCVNQSKCNMPSASVISNAHAWKLWIDTHVPCFILVLIKLSWLLNNIVTISAIVVSLVYLCYIYFAKFPTEPSWASELGNWHRHGINSIVAIIDLILLAYPIRIFHFVYVNAYGWLYALVTFIYFICDPKENIIYEQIDYNNPIQILAAYCVLTLLVFVMQTFHFLAYRLKLTIREKYLMHCLNQQKTSNIIDS